jgi:hypothetical protein
VSRTEREAIAEEKARKVLNPQRKTYRGAFVVRLSNVKPISSGGWIFDFLPSVKLLVRSSVEFVCSDFPDDRPTVRLEKLGNFIAGEGSS